MNHSHTGALIAAVLVVALVLIALATTQRRRYTQLCQQHGMSLILLSHDYVCRDSQGRLYKIPPRDHKELTHDY